MVTSVSKEENDLDWTGLREKYQRKRASKLKQGANKTSGHCTVRDLHQFHASVDIYIEKQHCQSQTSSGYLTRLFRSPVSDDNVTRCWNQNPTGNLHNTSTKENTRFSFLSVSSSTASDSSVDWPRFALGTLSRSHSPSSRFMNCSVRQPANHGRTCPHPIVRHYWATKLKLSNSDCDPWTWRSGYDATTTSIQLRVASPLVSPSPLTCSSNQTPSAVPGSGH